MGGKQSKPLVSETDTIPQDTKPDARTLRDNAVNSLQLTRESISKYEQILASTIEKIKSKPSDRQLLSNKTLAINNLITLRKKAIDLQKQIANYNVQLGSTAGGSRMVKKYTQYRKRNPRKQTRKYKTHLKKLFK